MHILISCVVFVIVTDRNAEAGQRCFECRDVPTPQSCTHVTECGEHEECFTESVISSNGLLLYNVGCMSKLTCTASKRASHFAKRDVLTACLECCSKGDFCNLDGCGFNAVPREKRGPYCYHCNVQEDQHSCQDVAVCGQDQVCFLEPILDLLPNINYKSRCGEKLTCLAAQQTHNNGNLSYNVDEIILGRRYAPFGDCPACCDIDFCNNDCNQNNSVATIHGTEAPVTSTLITTSFTITSAPVTTLITTKPTSTATHSVLTQATQLVTHVHQEHTSTHMPKTTNIVLGCSQYGGGYIQTRHLCIKFHFGICIFSNAATACAKEGAMLVTIDTEEKMSEIWSELHKISGHIPDLWIGGSDVNHTDTFYWQTGREVYPYNNWGKIRPQPNDPQYHDQDCIILHRLDNYTWYDEPCYRQYGFICEHPIQAIHTSTQHTSSCESHDRFHQLENNLGCVMYVQDHVDWNTANNYCRGNKSHLVNIESEEKQVAIYRFMKTHNENAYIWIDLHSTSMTPHNQHDWRWQTGLPYSYMHWALNHPDGTGNCVVMYIYGHWRSMHCSTEHSFICEK